MNSKKKINVGKFFLKVIIFVIILYGLYSVSVSIRLLGFFGGGKIMYYSGTALIALGLPLLIISIFNQRIKYNIKVWLWCSLIGLLLTINLINFAYDRYDRSFVRLSETSLDDVYNYRPFMAGSKAVSLNEPGSLQLTDPLPKLDGARALYPLYAAFAQAVYPERDYSLDSEVDYTNTIGAYQRLIERDVDIIFVVSPSKQQLQDAEDKGVQIKFTAIGKDAFVFFVNINNPVDNLTTEQLQAIYSGKITNWRQVGGNSQSIKAFQRNFGSGSQSAFINFMQQHQVMDAPNEDVIGEMGGIIQQTANYANYGNAVGFSFRYFAQQMVANNEIKLLSIDGVYPSVENIASGAYPLTVEFYAATLTDNQRVDVKKMLNWILSPQGQWLVEKTGYVPIRSPDSKLINGQ